MEDSLIFEDLVRSEGLMIKDPIIYEESIGSEDSFTEDDADEQEMSSDIGSGSARDSESGESHHAPTPSPSRFTFMDPEAVPVPNFTCMAEPSIQLPKWTSINAGPAALLNDHDDDEGSEQSSECNREDVGTISKNGILRDLILQAAKNAGIMVSKTQKDHVKGLKTSRKRSRKSSVSNTASPAARGASVDSSPEDSSSFPPSKVRMVEYHGSPLAVRLKSDGLKSAKPDSSNSREPLSFTLAIPSPEGTPKSAKPHSSNSSEPLSFTLTIPSPKSTPFSKPNNDTQATFLTEDKHPLSVQHGILQRQARFNETTRILKELKEEMEKDALRADDEARVIREHWGSEYVAEDHSNPGLGYTLSETVVDWILSGEIDLPEWCGLPPNPPVTSPATPSKTDRIQHRDAVSLAQDRRVYCICRRPDDGGRMVECPGKDCRARWYHWNCLTLPERKGTKAKSWVCSACRLKPEIEKGAVEPAFKRLDVKDRVSKMLSCPGITQWTEHPYGF